MTEPKPVGGIAEQNDDLFKASANDGDPFRSNGINIEAGEGQQFRITRSSVNNPVLVPMKAQQYQRNLKAKNSRHLSPNQQFNNYNFDINALERQVKKIDKNPRGKDSGHNFYINVDDKRKNVCSIDFRQQNDDIERFNEMNGGTPEFQQFDFDKNQNQQQQREKPVQKLPAISKKSSQSQIKTSKKASTRQELTNSDSYQHLKDLDYFLNYAKQSMNYNNQNSLTYSNGNNSKGVVFKMVENYAPQQGVSILEKKPDDDFKDNNFNPLQQTIPPIDSIQESPFKLAAKIAAKNNPEYESKVKDRENTLQALKDLQSQQLQNAQNNQESPIKVFMKKLHPNPMINIKMQTAQLQKGTTSNIQGLSSQYPQQQNNSNLFDNSRIPEERDSVNTSALSPTLPHKKNDKTPQRKNAFRKDTLQADFTQEMLEARKEDLSAVEMKLISTAINPATSKKRKNNKYAHDAESGATNHIQVTRNNKIWEAIQQSQTLQPHHAVSASQTDNTQRDHYGFDNSPNSGTIDDVQIQARQNSTGFYKENGGSNNPNKEKGGNGLVGPTINTMVMYNPKIKPRHAHQQQQHQQQASSETKSMSQSITFQNSKQHRNSFLESTPQHMSSLSKLDQSPGVYERSSTHQNFTDAYNSRNNAKLPNIKGINGTSTSNNNNNINISNNANNNANLPTKTIIQESISQFGPLDDYEEAGLDTLREGLVARKELSPRQYPKRQQYSHTNAATQHRDSFNGQKISSLLDTKEREDQVVATHKNYRTLEPRDNSQKRDATEEKNKINLVQERANKRLQEYLQSKHKGENGKEVFFNQKLLALREFLLKLQFSLNIMVKPLADKSFTPYKYYLCKGNNSIMIRNLIKSRWWWVQVDSKDQNDVNFIWTQLRQNKWVASLKARKRDKHNETQESVSSVSGNNDAITADTTIDGDEMSDSEEKFSGRKRNRGNSSVSQKKRKPGQSVGIQSEKNKSDDKKAANLAKLFTKTELSLMNSHVTNPANKKLWDYEDLESLNKAKKNAYYQNITEPNSSKCSNHLESTFHIGNKKALLYNMKSYYAQVKDDVFQYLPLTYHIQQGTEDKEYEKFLDYFEKKEAEIREQEKEIEDGKKIPFNRRIKNIWIIKPGENTNRGRGISVVSDLAGIKECMGENIQGRTYLIQQYLDRPLLYNRRKFDIRTYMMMSCINGQMKAYWYSDGYIRTSSKEFNLRNLNNKAVHLTNDAIQKKNEDYGKFENGNKLSYGDFQRFLDKEYSGQVSFENEIYAKMKNMTIDIVKASYNKIDPERREHGFEIFGLDFMIDQNLKVWLIEVNTNPDLATSSPLLTRIIPSMVDQAFRLTLDPLYPPPPNWANAKRNLMPENYIENNKWELIFDEAEDGPAVRALFQNDNGQFTFDIEEEDDDELHSDDGDM